jgi:hypothetical protein
MEASVFLHHACESAAFLLRASAKSDEIHGYEVALEPREQRLVLRRHAKELTVLAQAKANIATATDLRVKIQLAGSDIRVWLGDNLKPEKPTLAFRDAAPILAAGQLGVKTWGAALSIDGLSIRTEGGAAITIRNHQLQPAERRALQAFCLLLLNLNEVVYVD